MLAMVQTGSARLTQNRSQAQIFDESRRLYPNTVNVCFRLRWNRPPKASGQLIHGALDNSTNGEAPSVPASLHAQLSALRKPGR
jgi:hypothetical protein